MYTLNKAEQNLAHFLAEGRMSHSRKMGWSLAKVENSAVEQSTRDLEGVAGEIMVARYMNLYPDTDYESKTAPPKYDLFDPSGIRIDVKTTAHEPGNLVVNGSIKPDDCDRFISVVGEFPKYKIVGWCTIEELFEKAAFKSISTDKNGNPRKPCYLMYATDLHDFNQYWKF